MIGVALTGALIFMGMWKVKANGYDKINVDPARPER